MWNTVRRQGTGGYEKQELKIVFVKLEMLGRKLKQNLKQVVGFQSVIQGEDKNLKVEVINADTRLDEITEEIHGDGLKDTSQKADSWEMPR